MPLAQFHKFLFLVVCFAASSLGLAADESPANPPLNLLPWPKSIQQAKGEMVLHEKSRIMFGDSSLQTLAGIVSDEIFLLNGIRLPIAAGTAAAGDIGLVIDPQIQGEAYQLSPVTSKCTTCGHFRVHHFGASCSYGIVWSMASGMGRFSGW